MNFMNRVIVACCILLCTSVWKISAQDYPFRRADLPVEERVEDLVRRMTLEEKIDLLAGYQDFYLHPCERLGIPAFKLADGPLGLASWGLFGKATAFPSALSLAASWNRDLAAPEIFFNLINAFQSGLLILSGVFNCPVQNYQ